jgi:hypothetical protein
MARFLAARLLGRRSGAGNRAVPAEDEAPFAVGRPLRLPGAVAAQRMEVS